MDAWKIKTIRLELAKSPEPKTINSQKFYFSEIKAFEEWRDDRPITGALIELYLQELRGLGKSASRIWETFYTLHWWVRRLAYLGLLIDEITDLDLNDLETEEGKEFTLVIRSTGNVVRKIRLDKESCFALAD